MRYICRQEEINAVKKEKTKRETKDCLVQFRITPSVYAFAKSLLGGMMAISSVNELGRYVMIEYLRSIPTSYKVNYFNPDASRGKKKSDAPHD